MTRPPAPLNDVSQGGYCFIVGIYKMKLKPWTSYTEQVAKLKERFVVNDEETCIEKLKQIRYYRLSAYELPFKRKDGTYFENIPIERIFKIYEFDSRLRALLFHIIEDVEIRFRSLLSYFHSERYGSLGYLDPRNFSNKHNMDLFCKRLDDIIENNNSSLIISWHNKHYAGAFPLWVIIEFFSFGMLSLFYADMPTADQKIIGKEVGVNYKVLESWLRGLTDLRNICAHYSRIYYRQFSSTPARELSDTSPETDKVFSFFIVLKRLYPNTDNWKSICTELQSLINEYTPDISLKHIGFPEDWEKYL